MARPEPINAIHAHSKAKLSLYFSDSLFVAGEDVSGKMELECKAERGLGVADIKVELFAIQELMSRDHSATNTFLHLTRYFQGTGLPPSNAVHPHPLPGDDNVLPVDYYLARKGTTTFFFRFPLPVSSPASIDFGKGLAKLKYEVRASVGVSWRSERQRVMERKEVNVVEAPGDVSDVERIVVGENGKIWAQGRVLNPYVVAGRDACIELFVKNHSTKRTTSLSLSLARYLNLPATSHLQKKALQLSDVLANVPFRGPEYIVQPGTEGVANLVFTVPRNAQGVRSGRLETGEEDEGREPVESLFDVQCMAEIKIGMGLGSKDIILELPVTICHSSAIRSLPPPPPERFEAFPDPEAHTMYSPLTQTVSPYQSPPFGPTYDAYPAAFISPPMSPPLLPPQHPVWSPLPQVIPPPQQVVLDQWYYYPPPPLMHYAYPARPSSADPLVSRPLPSLPAQLANVAPGLPAQNGILPSPDPSARPEEGEPGKGERALRITAHLRMSSRNRSASPPSRRFPQVPGPLTPTTDNPPAQLRAAPPPPPPLLVDFPRTSPTQNHQVLSPRPVLTPKQSFSHDRGTLKSEHVIDLERMAAEQEAEKGMSNEGARNKTLPPAPVFCETLETPRLPPEPTLLPIPTRPRPEIWGRESGLAALERKLLEQVGTRKPDADRRPDVRSVLPDPIKIPSPNDARCDPPNDSAISSLALAPDGSFNDAPPLHPPPPKLDLAVGSSPPFRQDEIVGASSPGRRMVNGHGNERKKGKQNKARHLREAATGRVAAWLGGLDPASPPESQTPPVISPQVSLRDLPSPTDMDAHPLLRSPAAPGSPPDALGTSPSPASDASPKRDTIPTRSSGFVLHAAKDTSSTFDLPSPTEASEQPDSRNLSVSARPHNGVRVASSSEGATPKAATPSPLKPVLRRFAAGAEVPGSKGQPPQNKYDVRSARGGKGGRVTSVAALWASLASQQIEQEQQPQQYPEKSPPRTKQANKPAAGTFTPTFKGLQDKSSPSTSPQDKHKTPRLSPHTHAHAKKRHEDSSPSTSANGNRISTPNVTDLTARRARMNKATSVPAVVSSSFATPVLSSTASLARPIQTQAGQLYPKRSYPPTPTHSIPSLSTSPPIAERQRLQLKTDSSFSTSTPRGQASKSPQPVTSELAFGQARLKDLIKKYQQGFGQ